jgi:hypothetical protein
VCSYAISNRHVDGWIDYRVGRHILGVTYSMKRIDLVVRWATAIVIIVVCWSLPMVIVMKMHDLQAQLGELRKIPGQ